MLCLHLAVGVEFLCCFSMMDARKPRAEAQLKPGISVAFQARLRVPHVWESLSM